MEDVNKDFYFVNGGSRTAFQRWNLADDFNGVEILKDNPTTNTGSFTTTQQDYIAGKIAASDDVKLLFDGRTVTVQKDTSANQNANKKYTVSGSTITPDTGWIVVVPVHNYGASGGATGGDSDNDGYIDGYRIDLKSNDSGIYADSSNVITHEFAHATLYPGGDVTMGHTSRLVSDQSITSLGSVGGRTACTKPCTFDEKAAKLIYEPTLRWGLLIVRFWGRRSTRRIRPPPLAHPPPATRALPRRAPSCPPLPHLGPHGSGTPVVCLAEAPAQDSA